MAKKKSQASYEALLRSFEKTRPLTGKLLKQMHQNRQERLSNYVRGVRLKGFEELLGHLSELETVFSRNRKLRGVAFLLDRARGDFEIALDAGLSGLNSVAHDAMRDVMEIEFLFREFEVDPQQIAAWLACSPTERNNQFRPAILRQRHASRLGVSAHDLPEAVDYRGHSEALHVSTFRNPFGSPGLRTTTVPFGDDAFFWEIFEHARRLLLVTHRLRRRVARHLKSPLGLERGLKDVRQAWERTREMQAILMALVQAASEVENEGEEDGAA